MPGGLECAIKMYISSNKMRIEVSGVWDLMHSGHVRLFKRVRQLAPPGEAVTLIVGVHSDKAVETYKRAPIIPYAQRVEMVAACRYVDEVVPEAPLVVTEKYMDEHAIDLVVHAHAEGDSRYEHMYKVAIAQGKFKRLDYTAGISTTEIIERARGSLG